jgi:hypothetical protein
MFIIIIIIIIIILMSTAMYAMRYLSFSFSDPKFAVYLPSLLSLPRRLHPPLFDHANNMQNFLGT